jgi:hypothetical protein
MQPRTEHHSQPPSRTSRSWRGLSLLLAAVALLLVGCIRAEVSIKVNDDGSGEVSVLAAFDEEAFETLAEDFGDGATTEIPSFGDIDESDLPEGASIEEYDEDGFTGARVTIPFEASDDIAATINEILSESGGDGFIGGTDSTFEDFSLQREGEGWRFEATAAALNDAADGEDALGLGGPIFDLLFDDASFEIKIELPGDVIEHNADRIDGDTLVWELGLADDEPRQLMALTGADDGGGFNLVIAVVVLAVIGAVVAGVLWFLAQTRNASGGV